jgi:prevent-host-death family protein
MKANATQFKNHFGEYLQKSYQEPIIVEKSGKPSAVLISYALFEKFFQLEDRYWGMLAERAVKEGFLGVAESEKRLLQYAKRAGIDIDDETQAN